MWCNVTLKDDQDGPTFHTFLSTSRKENKKGEEEVGSIVVHAKTGKLICFSLFPLSIYKIKKRINLWKMFLQQNLRGHNIILIDIKKI